MEKRRLRRTSLTAELDRDGSPILGFLQGSFPIVPSVAAAAAQALKQCETLKPTAQIDYTRVSTAAEYFMRALLPNFEFAGTVAHVGLLAEQKYSEGCYSEDVCRDFEKNFKSVLEEARKDHNLLAKLACALALLTDIARKSALGYPFPYRDWREMLRWPADEVEEVAVVGNRAYKLLSQLSQSTVVGGPILGNVAVGADADLIMDGCLIDLKVTIQTLGPAKWRRNLYQLLGYVLLDVQDKYRIDHIGVVMARQNRFLRWPLSEFVSDSAALSRMRSDFAQVQEQFARDWLKWDEESVSKYFVEVCAAKQ